MSGLRESHPPQTAAMGEIATILGGVEHFEEFLDLKTRTDPKLIRVCTTALVEARAKILQAISRTLCAQRNSQALRSCWPTYLGKLVETGVKLVDDAIAAIEVYPEVARPMVPVFEQGGHVRP